MYHRQVTHAPLSAAFLSPGIAGDALGSPGELEAALLALHDAGRAAWPGVDVAGPVFARYLGERVAGRDVADALGACHVEDLYLACACARGVAPALLSFERAFAVHVPAFVRRVDPSPAFADDVAQVLRERLFVGAAPKIAEYEGRSDLYGAEFLKRYSRLVQARPGWQEYWDSFHFTHALLPPDTPLRAALEQAGWRPVYQDKTAILLVFGRT